MPKLFISHSSRDRHFVDNQLIPVLRNSGVDWWYSTTEITGGELWEDEIRQGLAASETVLVLVSRASKRSEWVKTEIALALKRKRRVIPVLLDDTAPEEIHLRLVRRQYVDLREPDGAAWKRLLSVLGAEGAEPSSSHSAVPRRAASLRSKVVPVAVTLLLVAVAVLAWRFWLSGDTPGSTTLVQQIDFSLEYPTGPWADTLQTAWLLGMENRWREARDTLALAIEQGAPREEIPEWLEDGIEKWEAEAEYPTGPWADTLQIAWLLGMENRWREARDTLALAIEQGAPREEIPEWLEDGIEKWEAEAGTDAPRTEVGAISEP